MDRRLFVSAGASIATLAFAGCTTTSPDDKSTNNAAKRREIDAAADGALSRLVQTIPDTKQLAARSRGILVFPNVIAGGLIVGAEAGDGCLRVQGRTSGYYRTISGSIGLQAGGQSKAMVFFFTTPEALEKFQSSNGWAAGGDASVAVATVGANGNIDSATLNKAVVVFVMTNAGLMANLNVEGTKVTKLDI